MWFITFSLIYILSLVACLYHVKGFESEDMKKVIRIASFIPIINAILLIVFIKAYVAAVKYAIKEQYGKKENEEEN